MNSYNGMDFGYKIPRADRQLVLYLACIFRTQILGCRSLRLDSFHQGQPPSAAIWPKKHFFQSERKDVLAAFLWHSAFARLTSSKWPPGPC